MDMNTRVMIIEDDLVIAQLHQRYLEQIGGFEVVGIATNKREAEMQLSLLAPDLILLDVYLPDGTGLEILQQSRSNQDQCDVILITAARDVGTLQQAMRYGVVDYLLKPVVFSRLESAMQKYQRLRQQLTEAGGLDQGVIDKMLSSPAGASTTCVEKLPKGIDAVTLDKIRKLFQDHVLLTADEAGEQIGASRTTARRYLEYLNGTGELISDVNYGTVGRPERCYQRKG
ncbi:response regulator [Vibrio rhizosphaerae]|uniref:Transcriptional regulatory protein n=1 Tax=Vibrio rhizosphaerae TaxID=398736 RepID=A0ABU4IVD2_9VIBR|nr:response regulator [Vibrio rhizosphaerae]MDW6092873.1 response regulator [Vibrio rhizosphaerae]